jgi:hypothetical protein
VEIGLGRNEHAVLMALAYHTGLDGSNTAWPAQTTIARMAGISIRAIRNSLRRLEASGAIETAYTVGKGSSYRITPEMDGHEWQKTPAQRAALDRGRVCRTTPAQRSALPRHSMPPNKSIRTRVVEQENSPQTRARETAQPMSPETPEQIAAGEILAAQYIVHNRATRDLIAQIVGYVANELGCSRFEAEDQVKLGLVASKPDFARAQNLHFWLEDNDWRSWALEPQKILQMRELLKRCAEKPRARQTVIEGRHEREGIEAQQGSGIAGCAQ